MKVYARKALGHARIVAAALHDPQLCPIEQTRMMFNNHSVLTVVTVADVRARQRAEDEIAEFMVR